MLTSILITEDYEKNQMGAATVMKSLAKQSTDFKSKKS